MRHMALVLQTRPCNFDFSQNRWLNARLVSHNTGTCARTVVVALNVLRGSTAHVALREFELTVDVGPVHLGNAVGEARHALAVVAPR